MQVMQMTLSNALAQTCMAAIWCQLAKYAHEALGCVYLSNYAV